MKKWLLILLVGLAIIAVVYLDTKGIIRWQPLSILVAALAAPFRFLWGLFGNAEARIRKQHAEVREREAAYQEDLETRIQTREQRINELNREVEMLDAKLELLKTKRALVDAEVESMSLQQLRSAGQKYFGK
jgi:uncharacterized protein YlxW (UPF0749 family)